MHYHSVVIMFRNNESGRHHLIVCVCNGLRDRDVLAAARSERSICPRRAYARLGAEPQCGQCLDHAEELIVHDQADALVGAD